MSGTITCLKYSLAETHSEATDAASSGVAESFKAVTSFMTSHLPVCSHSKTQPPWLCFPTEFSKTRVPRPVRTRWNLKNTCCFCGVNLSLCGPCMVQARVVVRC